MACRQTVAGQHNRRINDATGKRFHHSSHNQLRLHLADVLAACPFARRRKALNGLTPQAFICKFRTAEPDRFILDPIHQMPGQMLGQMPGQMPALSNLSAQTSGKGDFCRGKAVDRHHASIAGRNCTHACGCAGPFTSNAGR